MRRRRNIAMRDYQESVTTGQTDGQSDPYVPLCFAGDTKIGRKNWQLEMCQCDTDAPVEIAKLEYGTC